MTTHKAFALLYFLLCFCFLSTSYAQPCLAETDLANEYHCQVSLEETPESYALLNSNPSIVSFGDSIQSIEFRLVENRISRILPCCNRDPPPHYLIIPIPIL